MSNFIIVTGCSSGLGEAIAKNLLIDGNSLVCLSRSCNKSVIKEANAKNIPLKYITFDLGDTNKIEEQMNSICYEILSKEINSISLINNAGVVLPINKAGKYSNNEVLQNINVNLTAPIILTNIFIKFFSELAINKIIINISSGASVKPVEGWGAYCTSKAGLNMFTQCVGLEQEKNKFPVKIIAVRPGVIDTNMQASIRNSKVNEFPDLMKFINYKNDGSLKTPDFVAKKIIGLLDGKSFKNGSFVDITTI